MDGNALAALVISSLSWPAVVCLLLFLLRKNLSGIAERIEEVSLPGGAKAKFVKAMEKVHTEAELVESTNLTSVTSISPRDETRLQLAEQFPEAAIIDAYKEVEGSIIPSFRVGQKGR